MRDRWRAPPPRDGRDGESVDVEVLRQLIGEAVTAIPPARNGRDGRDGAPGEAKQGDPGPRGPQGPIGPMPAHRWRGTKLQFEQAPGETWGDAVDLQGPRGDQGLPGVGGGVVTINGAGGGSGWFPGGW